jgi:hypothetical protein
VKLIIDKSNRLAHEWVWEWHYYNSIFRYMNKDIFFNNYNVIFTDNLDLLKIEDPQNTIVFICSDEKYTVPKYKNEVKAIFKNYVYPDQEINNIFPIPQGYNKNLIPFPAKNIHDRKYDISFQGNIHTNRGPILSKIFNEIQKNNLNININFKESSNMLEYSESLHDTKISLCLDGQITPENFRFFESSIFGCVIFASENLPKNWIYESPHYIKVNWFDARQVVSIIHKILNDKNKLEYFSQMSLSAWGNKYCPQKVCEYVKEKIQ